MIGENFSGQKIQNPIERIFKIWKERKVFDKKFVDDLKKRITSEYSKNLFYFN